MNRLVIVLALAFVVPAVSNAGDFGVFRKAMKCTGPYDQPQLGLPSDYIEVQISWDPLFENSDVSVKIGSLKETGIAAFYIAQPHPPGPSDPYPEQHRKFFEGRVRMNSKSLHLDVYHGQERDYESPVDEGRLDGFVLNCRTANSVELQERALLKSLHCTYSDNVFVKLSFEPGKASGEADFSVLTYLKSGKHRIPWIEHFFGPIPVTWRPEGSHFSIEGSNFQFLVKESPVTSGYIGLLRVAPPEVSRLKMSPAPEDRFSCSGFGGE